MKKVIKGIAASKGIAIAKVLHFHSEETAILKSTIMNASEELNKLHHAIALSKKEIQLIMEHALISIGQAEADIFAAHLLILEDEEFIQPIEGMIQQQFVNAEYAVHTVATELIAMFESFEDEYLSARATDIFDVKRRLVAHLLGKPVLNLKNLTEERIVVANDLTPSDTALLNGTYVKGFATAVGGKTSHSVIIAKSLEIPAVVGLKSILEDTTNGDTVILDGYNGLLIVSPTYEDIKYYQQQLKEHHSKTQEDLKYTNIKTVTLDQKAIELGANIASPKDIASVLKYGCEGIGLFRTEFIYMGRKNLPTEEEQFLYYKEVLEKMNNNPVVVRTFDIGGDKEIPYLNLPKERNPFLGYRAIRISLKRQDIFRVQLRALLRASVYGNLKIMFPMIATVEEFRLAKTILNEEKEKLLSESIAVSTSIEVGMMVEIPSVALIADILSKEVDFFSIGTNDLIQYTIATDRMNEEVSYLYQPFHPAIIRLIHMITKAAHAENKWVGMCGEMAADYTAIPLLIALGLDELSMSASSILSARKLISTISYEQMQEHLQKILQLSTAEEVEQYIRKLMATNIPHNPHPHVEKKYISE